MLSQKQIIEAVKNGRKSQTLDGRDYSRLVDFFALANWESFGFSLDSVDDLPEKKEWSEEAVIEQMKTDVAFGFQKALDQRGISASAMNEVVKMWLWILEDDLQNFDAYAQYGLPFFKAVAVKYGFDNPIGDDQGNEDKYAG